MGDRQNREETKVRAATIYDEAGKQPRRSFGREATLSGHGQIMIRLYFDCASLTAVFGRRIM